MDESPKGLFAYLATQKAGHREALEKVSKAPWKGDRADRMPTWTLAAGVSVERNNNQ